MAKINLIAVRDDETVYVTVERDDGSSFGQNLSLTGSTVAEVLEDLKQQIIQHVRVQPKPRPNLRVLLARELGKQIEVDMAEIKANKP